MAVASEAWFTPRLFCAVNELMLVLTTEAILKLLGGLGPDKSGIAADLNAPPKWGRYDRDALEAPSGRRACLGPVGYVFGSNCQNLRIFVGEASYHILIF